MSFHPRKYQTFFDEKYDFPTSDFKDYLAKENHYNIIDKHLINEDQFGPITDIHVGDFLYSEGKRLLDWQDLFRVWLENKTSKKWILFLFNEEQRKRVAKEEHLKAVKNASEKKKELTW